MFAVVLCPGGRVGGSDRRERARTTSPLPFRIHLYSCHSCYEAADRFAIRCNPVRCNPAVDCRRRSAKTGAHLINPWLTSEKDPPPSGIHLMDRFQPGWILLVLAASPTRQQASSMTGQPPTPPPSCG